MPHCTLFVLRSDLIKADDSSAILRNHEAIYIFELIDYRLLNLFRIQLYNLIIIIFFLSRTKLSNFNYAN